MVGWEWNCGYRYPVAMILDRGRGLGLENFLYDD
jgi:hypothetical protein